MVYFAAVQWQMTASLFPGPEILCDKCIKSKGMNMERSDNVWCHVGRSYVPHVHLITCYFYRRTAEQKAQSPIYGLSFVAFESFYTRIHINWIWLRKMHFGIFVVELWQSIVVRSVSSIKIINIPFSMLWLRLTLIVRWRTISQLLRSITVLGGLIAIIHS